MGYAIATAWLLSVMAAFVAGFHWSKRFSFHSSVRGEVARRCRVLAMYARATVAALVPAYRRRWDRQREESLRADRESLVPFERADWWHERNASRPDVGTR